MAIYKCVECEPPCFLEFEEEDDKKPSVCPFNGRKKDWRYIAKETEKTQTEEQ